VVSGTMDNLKGTSVVLSNSSNTLFDVNVKQHFDHFGQDDEIYQKKQDQLKENKTACDSASESDQDQKEDSYKGDLAELADNPVLWNVKLLCQDGIVQQNKLIVGLIFPALKSSDSFGHQTEPYIIMAGYTKTEIFVLIQDAFERMYSSQRDVPQNSKYIEDLEDDIDLQVEVSSTTRKRGRPKGSTNSRKKVKIEENDWNINSESNEDVKDEDDFSTQSFIFPITFDISSANSKFNKLLNDVKSSSEKIISNVDKKDRWKCSLCGQVCANLAVHIGRNHADLDFSCSQCDAKVGSEYLLKLHEKTHLNEAKPCNICGKNVKDLKNHMIQKHHGESKAKIQCPQCPKVYTKNAEYQRHFNSAHLGIKANCPICNKELLPNKITSHVRMVHDKVKNHFCSSCGKGFYDKRDMDLHIQRIHLGTKELCIECGKELSAGQLKNHVKKCHSGDNLKVVCPVCGKKVGYLDEHMRSVHKKEKNHQCPICPLKCYKRNTLKRHLEWHEKGKTTVNGTPKKPRILRRNKNSEELSHQVMPLSSSIPQSDNHTNIITSMPESYKHHSFF